MTIYTGRGDSGMTDLLDNQRVPKASPRLEISGTLDELNAFLGIVRPTGQDDVDDVLLTVQNHVHVLQSEYANPDVSNDDPQITGEDVETLEAWIDTFDEETSTLDSFVLPGGTDSASKLQYARALCRRTERRAVALEEDEDPGQALVYLNRLSDLLFVLARVLNHRADVQEPSPTY